MHRLVFSSVGLGDGAVTFASPTSNVRYFTLDELAARPPSHASGGLRQWLCAVVEAAYDAGHAAGLDDLSKITAPVGTPLDEVADLRREVERLKAENETLQRREPTLTEMRVALGKKPEGSCLGWPTVRRCHKCADPTPGGPTLCHPCGLKMNEERFVERGRLKGWQEAIAAAEAESTEAVKAMQEADRVAEKAADDAVRCRNEAVGAATVADTLRRAAPKVTA